jgi:hypothetical protein
MSLNETVLFFDKHVITEEQIISHVKHYVELAEKGLQTIEKNKSEAMSCLREIRSTMAEEYNYYSRSRVQETMEDNHLYNTYYAFIQEAFVKQNAPNAYSNLSSNLYDVMDYGRYYFRKYLDVESE